ncbi:TPA: hypothetical protein DDW35_07600 [Candidatus Sumerlaeota bacterium]|nr:hypothetical protein [Candidatus Sumerlaeota bacterium]
MTFESAGVKLDVPGLKHPGGRGPLLFTHRGISGPAALDVSGEVAALLQSQQTVTLRLALLDEKQPQDGAQIVEGWRKSRDGNKLIRKLVAELIPEAVAEKFCTLSGLDSDSKLCRLTRDQARLLSDCLSGVRVTITDTEGFAKAMVTRGGVKLDEVSPKTLESRLVSGLFFIGEVLDVDGPCGGYNLQWAFSSGNLAGRNAATA